MPPREDLMIYEQKSEIAKIAYSIRYSVYFPNPLFNYNTNTLVFTINNIDTQKQYSNLKKYLSRNVRDRHGVNYVRASLLSINRL